MKRILFIFGLFCFGLTSCENKEKQQAEQLAIQNAERAKQDSLTKIQIAEEQARLEYQDSIAIYAWGDVKFGMTKREVLQSNAFSGARKYDDSYSMEIDKQFAINRSLKLNKIASYWIDFGGKTNNEVYNARINETSEWDDFKDFRDDIITFIREFNNKYGSPSYINDDIFTLNYRVLDERRYNKLRIAEWVIGSGRSTNGIKYINMYVYKGAGSAYQYDCVISNSIFSNEHEIDTSRENTEQEKDALENAF